MPRLWLPSAINYQDDIVRTSGIKRELLTPSPSTSRLFLFMPKEVFRLNRHWTCVGAIFPQAEAIVSKTFSN